MIGSDVGWRPVVVGLVVLANVAGCGGSDPTAAGTAPATSYAQTTTTAAEQPSGDDARQLRPKTTSKPVGNSSRISALKRAPAAVLAERERDIFANGGRRSDKDVRPGKAKLLTDSHGVRIIGAPYEDGICIVVKQSDPVQYGRACYSDAEVRAGGSFMMLYACDTSPQTINTVGVVPDGIRKVWLTSAGVQSESARVENNAFSVTGLVRDDTELMIGSHVEPIGGNPC